PRTIIAASAVGYYGDRGDELLDESSQRGSGFLPDVCTEWEHATESARAAAVRVVNLRIGIVLSPLGGVIQKLITPFSLGAGGMVGSGRQYMSWIALDDLIGVIHFALQNDTVHGAVNATAPEPVTNSEFVHTFARLLHRPAIVPLPA